MDQEGYPEVDHSFKQISFQLHPRFKNRRTYQIPTRTQPPKNAHSFQVIFKINLFVYLDGQQLQTKFKYDFSLEERLQEIFLRRQKQEEADEVVIDEGDDQAMSPGEMKTPPPIPPRASKTADQNDSGKSASLKRRKYFRSLIE
jgi:hypothetical protein